MARINKQLSIRIENFNKFFGEYWGFDKLNINEISFDDEIAVFINTKNPDFTWTIRWRREEVNNYARDFFEIYYEEIQVQIPQTIFHGTFALNNKGYIRRILYSCYNSDNLWTN